MLILCSTVCIMYEQLWRIADRSAFYEVRVREGDRRTSRECRQESGTARPVGKLSQILAHFHSTFGECLGRCIHYSRVRHTHVDTRYWTLHTSTKDLIFVAVRLYYVGNVLPSRVISRPAKLRKWFNSASLQVSKRPICDVSEMTSFSARPLQ